MGFTSQYDGLQELYKTYKDKLVVIGLPCNQFGGQEPGTAKEIVTFCKANYGVDFPLSSKIEVKRGQPAPTVQVAYLKEAKRGDGFYSKVEFPEISGRREWPAH